MFQACLPLAGMEHLDKEKLCDVVHIGSWQHPEYHKERRELFEHLADQEMDLKLIDPKTDPEKAMVTAKLPELYQRSKVAIGCCHVVDGYHSNRLMLATGNGGFYFCNHFPWVEKLFEPQEEIITFDLSNVPEVVRFQLKVWLGHDDLREKVRAAGFKRAQADHTYLVRMRQVMDEIEARR